MGDDRAIKDMSSCLPLLEIDHAKHTKSEHANKLGECAAGDPGKLPAGAHSGNSFESCTFCTISKMNDHASLLDSSLHENSTCLALRSLTHIKLKNRSLCFLP
jgi:hypothetical protein